MNDLKVWGIKPLYDLYIEQRIFKSNGYSILYSATEPLHLLIYDNEIHLEPETFYFIPPNSPLQLLANSKTAQLIWFTIDLFVDRLEFLTHIKQGIFFRNPVGFGVKNTFMKYDDIIKHYYSPLQNSELNRLFSRNLLINFLEFILIRTLLEVDPKMEDFRQDSYEKKIVGKFIHLLEQENTFNFKMEYYSSKLNVTKRTLDNAVNKIYGCTTKRFVIAKAVERAKKLLLGTGEPIKTISLDLGFSEESNFSNFFKKHTGNSPREYREQALMKISDF